MLFNSYTFIFAFLPITLFVYFSLASLSRNWALRWIIVASLVFYAWWRPENTLIIVPAMLVNFTVARIMLRCVESGQSLRARLLLAGGIVFNICVLGYFKYTNFLAAASNDLFGTSFTFHEIVLPLGISFITFQKIAFLIDVHGRKITSFKFQDFFSFVLFFPQLIAGPIVHYREMMPQFHAAVRKPELDNITVGLTLFFFGLFKKVVIADSIAPMVSTVFAAADAGQSVSMLPAWLAALGFTFQIYFDFSGYSDMALGGARLFGIRLPVNFMSPLRSSSIIDFWLRWHVSLTRFLTAYVYNPLALALTRRRLSAGKPGIMGGRTSLGAFLQLLVLPTMVTFLISGIWHGAGYQFIVWGLLHGFYLSVNHGWRLAAQRLWPRSATYARIMKPVGFVLTFLCVVVSMVVFRALSMDTAINVLGGMAGLNGVLLPDAIYGKLAAVMPGALLAHVSPGLENFGALVRLGGWLVFAAGIGLVLPNTLQIFCNYEPAIGIKPTDGRTLLGRELRWKPTIAWGLFIAAVAYYAIFSIGGYTEFLYWQF